MCTSSWKVSVFYAVQHGVWLKLIIAAVTGTCVFGDAATFINKYCRILFGDIFIVPFLGSALGHLIAICSPGWGNLVAFDWNDLPVGREFYGKFLKNVKSPPYALRRPLFLPSKQQSFSLKNICEFMFNGPDQLNTGCAGGSSKGKAWNAIVSLLPSYVPTWRSGDETARRVEVVEGPEFEPGRKLFLFLFFLLFSFSFSFFFQLL